MNINSCSREETAVVESAYKAQRNDEDGFER